jgi:hypothetical protein
MTRNSQTADRTASAGALARQAVGGLFNRSGDVYRQITASVDDSRGQMQRDDRAGVGLYALVVIGLVVVGAAAFFVVGGGVLDGDTADGEVNSSDPAPDQDPVPVDSGDGTQGENTTDQNSDGDENKDDGDENDDGPAYATISGSVTVTDLGPAEEGGVGLYNRSSERFVELHDFENGSEFVFDELPPGHTYELSVESERAPPETLSVTPDPNETVQREIEVGHEFEGAYSYEADWRLEYESGDVLSDGYTVIDSEGNAFSSWNDPKAPERNKNFYLADNNESYTTFGQGEWKAYQGHFESNETVQTHIIRRGLGKIKNRTYIGEATDRDDGGILYKYRLSKEAAPFDIDGPSQVYIDPGTGYVRYVDHKLSEWPGDSITVEWGWAYNHEGEDIVAIPEDFPIDDLPSER